MDLLDLELDLQGEGSSSSSGRATRSSRGNNAAVTPANVPKSQTRKSTATPKNTDKKEASAAAPSTVSTPRVVATPKTTVPKKTSAAKTPAPAVDVATPVVKKTPARKKMAEPIAQEESEAAPEEVIAEPVVNEEPEDAEMPEASESTSQQTRGRSPSLDKRSRHKAKKRFSPSPVAKKRKTMTAIATPTTTPVTPAVAPKKKKTAAPLDEQEEFKDNIRRVCEAASQQGPQPYAMPEEWKAMSSSTTDNANNDDEEEEEETAPPAVQTPKAGKKTPKKEQTSSSSTVRGRMSTTSAPATTEDVETSKGSTVAAKKETADRRRSKKVEKIEEELKNETEDSEEPAPEEPVINKKKPSNRGRKSVPATAVIKEELIDDDDEPTTSEPVNPAVKKRGAPPKKAKKTPAAPVVKEEPHEDPEDVEVAPESAPAVVPTPKVKKEKSAPVAAAAPVAPVVPVPTPTRASGRVSKPNRLYQDSSFNTEVLGRTRVTEQNPVKEAQAKDATPEPQELPPTRRKSTAPAAPRPPPTPKPIPVHNGVQRGYVPSRKVPLADYEVDGVVVKLNEDVNDVVDVLMLKVCKDGVVKHEDIDPKVVKAKTRAKIDSTKRVRLEARKLNIAMNASANTPSTSDELGKRKRQAPKSIEDIYWTPPTNRQKTKDKSTSRDPTPLDDDDDEEEAMDQDEEVVHPGDEKRQQKARRSISNMLDEQMDASIKSAKVFSVRFDAFIKPKIVAAQKTARIKLMSRRRQSMDPDDFFYQEMLTDQVSPSTSNVENEGEAEDEDVDVVGLDEVPEPEISEDMSVAIRTEALDTAEQIVVIVPRQKKHDGTPQPLEHLHTKAMEHLESRKLCLTETLPIVIEQFSYESVVQTTRQGQGCAWHTVTTANAQNLKNVFAMTDTVREDAICWTHLFLLENLPVNYLAAYLSVLRYAKRTDPIRMGYIINSTKDEEADAEWVNITDIVKAFAHKKFTEPGTEVLKNTIPVRRFENTVFLLVPPTLTSGDQRHHHRQPYGRIYRWLQSIGHADSEMITCTDELDVSCSVAEYLCDVVVERICDTVRQKRSEKPNCKVVLVGYASSTYMVHRAVNLVGGVSAIISIGFPVMSGLGRRGTADDEILLTYCPTLFIVGAQGQRFNNQAMVELRNAMVSKSGLLIVGYSNDLLLVPTNTLVRLGISQTIVYRMILEKILDFLNIPAIRDHHNVAELVPYELNDIHELDQSLLKGDKGLSGLAFASTPSSPLPSPVTSSGRRATVSGADEAMSKRKREPAHHPLLSTSSSLGGGAPPPLTPSPKDRGGFLAFQSLMTSSTATADDMPRRASMGASPRVVERGDFRDHRAARPSVSSAYSSAAPGAQPQHQKPSPRGPLDPASISLA